MPADLRHGQAPPAATANSDDRPHPPPPPPLDLACGTGRIAVAPPGHATEVGAVDGEACVLELRDRAPLDDRRDRAPLDAEPRVPDPARGPGKLAFAPAGHMSEVGTIDQQAETVAFGRRKAAHAGIDNVRWAARRLSPHLARRGRAALLWAGAPWRVDPSRQQVLGAMPVGGEAAIERHLRRSVVSLLGSVRSTSFPNRSVLVDQANAFARGVTFVGELARR